MSNGTRVTPSPDYISLLADALAAEDPVLTTEAAHLNLNWTRLIGFTNVQGREINGSANPCSTNADASTGRFLHVEQERTRLRNNLAGWNKMANAVQAIFPCVTVGVEQLEQEMPLSIFPNPSRGQVRIEGDIELDDRALFLFNHLGQDVSSHLRVSRVGEKAISLDLSSLPGGLYFLRCGPSSGRLILQR